MSATPGSALQQLPPQPRLPAGRGAFTSGKELLLWLLKYGAPSLVQIAHRALKHLLLGSYTALHYLLRSRGGLLSLPLTLVGGIRRGLIALISNRLTHGVLALVSHIVHLDLRVAGYRETNEAGWPAASSALHAGVALLSGIVR